MPKSSSAQTKARVVVVTVCVGLPEVEPRVPHRCTACRQDQALEREARAGELWEDNVVTKRGGAEVHASDLPGRLREAVAHRRRGLSRSRGSRGEHEPRSEGDEPGACGRHDAIEATTRSPAPD